MNDLIKYNLIIHTTSRCNLNCTYCDVIKDGKIINNDTLLEIISFIIENNASINTLKFFGGEPLIRFDDIKKIINETKLFFNGEYEIVTNGLLLTEEIGMFLNNYFNRIFISVDIENFFDFDKINKIIEKCHIKDKVIFNLMFNIGTCEEMYKIFEKLYKFGYKRFNLLPIYYTVSWDKSSIKDLSVSIKKILDKKITDNEIMLFGFQKNDGYNHLLTYDSIFCDCDGGLYYSDFVSTRLGQKIKDKLFIGKISKSNIINIKLFEEKKDILLKYEYSLGNKLIGHKELHSVMDYFSIYLNKNVH